MRDAVEGLSAAPPSAASKDGVSPYRVRDRLWSECVMKGKSGDPMVVMLVRVHDGKFHPRHKPERIQD